jgi:hypothetical protein
MNMNSIKRIWDANYLSDPINIWIIVSPVKLNPTQRSRNLSVKPSIIYREGGNKLMRISFTC